MLSLKDWLHMFGKIAAIFTVATMIVFPPAALVYFAIESGLWILIVLAFVVFIVTIMLAVNLYERFGR